MKIISDKKTLCKHWYDDTGEYCAATHRGCSCSAIKGQCNYPRYFNAGERKIARLVKEEAIKRTIAAVRSH